MSSLEYQYEQRLIQYNLGLIDDIPPMSVDMGNRFLVIRRLQHGGMGVVYWAEDTTLHRQVAIKLINDSERPLSQRREQLLREAQLLAQIEHENVVRVHDVSESDDDLYITMEFVAGPTLRSWQAEHSPDEVIELYLQAGCGLAEAHARGIVHRDFKPDNVLVDSRRRRAVVVDFGLAEDIVHGETSQVRIGGTRGYMAPEQIMGEVSPACDQYSFCVALWEALVGRRPFLDDDRPGPPTQPASMADWLYAVFLRGLASEPAQRFPDMPALLEAIANWRRRSRRWPWSPAWV